MKLIFLFKQIFEIKGENDLEFIPYDLGPFATDFQFNLIPLITEEIVTYSEFCDKDVDYISESYYKEYKLNKNRKTEILNFLEKEYVENDEYKETIDLIKFLTEFYDQNHTKDLIQLCYFLEPDFTQNSVIEDEVEFYNRVYNQKFILESIIALNENDLLKLFKNVDGILKIFNIDDTNIEKNNFHTFLGEHLRSIKYNEVINVEGIIEIIDNISIKDPNKTYKLLKYNLLELYSLIDKKQLSPKIDRILIQFFLKCLTLQWTLDNKDLKKFRNIVKELKKMIQITSIRKNQPALKIDYELLKDELDNDFQKKRIKLIEKKIKNQKTEIEKKIPDEFLIDKKNLSNLYEEYSSIGQEELEKITSPRDSEGLNESLSEN